MAYNAGRYSGLDRKLPRQSKGARLWYDRRRNSYVIRDGARFVRTGSSDLDAAQKLLGDYIAANYRPRQSSCPSIAEILLAYLKEVVPQRRTARNLRYNVSNLNKWWGDKRVMDVTSANCRAYAEPRQQGGALVDLKILQAAINHWHKEHGPLEMVPRVTIPANPLPRTRWLTRSEAARLLKVARKTPYLARMILLCLYTGSRKGVILALKWDQIDLKRAILHRRPQMAAGALNKRAPPVRLGRRILAHLRRWERLDGGSCATVCHYNGQSIKQPHRSWDRICKSAGLKGVTPHTLRHTRATWLMQKGAPVWDVAGHLGMTVKTLEQTYGHHHPDYQGGVADL